MNKEMIKKVREAKSAEELLALAKENNIELAEEQAKEYFKRIHTTGELSDEELNNVVGGGCGGGGAKIVYYDTKGCTDWIHRDCGGKVGQIHVSTEYESQTGITHIKTYTGPGCLICKDHPVMCHNCQYAVPDGASYKCTAP